MYFWLSFKTIFSEIYWQLKCSSCKADSVCVKWKESGGCGGVRAVLQEEAEKLGLQDARACELAAKYREQLGSPELWEMLLPD